MRMTSGADSSRSFARPAVGPAFVILVFPLILSACQRDAAQAGEENAADSLAGHAQPVAASDSLGMDGSAAADTTAEREEAEGGFLARIFGKRNQEEQKAEEEPVPVELAEVEVQDVPLYLSGTATLEAEKQADILAKIEGEVRRIEVEEGDWVHEGQRLAILDGEAQRVALEEAEARVRALRLDLERSRSLHEMGLTSDKELNDAQFRFEEAEAQGKGARLRLDYTEIVAPFSGQISQRLVDPGQTVPAGTPIFTIVDPQPLLARIHLPEKQVARISPRQGVIVNPDADASLEFPGEVLRVAPMVDPRTGTVKITCQVADRASSLRPGSFVRVKVQTDLHEEALVIPKRALVPEGGETYVFKTVRDSVVKCSIATGFANGSVIEVVQGLQAGDRVVTVGQGGLKTGSKFREVTNGRVALAGESDSTGSTQR